MINLTQENYFNWQNKLKQQKLFRIWWQFWSNYAFVFYLLAGFYLYGNESMRPMLWLGATSFFTARLIVTILINIFYKKQRPYQKFNFEPITSWFFSWKDVRPNSFPSRHTITFAAMAASVFVFDPLVGILLLIVTAMTGVGRVILGFHWPSDILAGLILGSIIGYFVTLLGLTTIFT